MSFATGGDVMSRTLTAVAVISLLLFNAPVARADVVQDWNAIMLTTMASQNPFLQVRLAAITHAAIFEAVNAITGQYEPYLGTITAPPGASAEAAAVTAAHDVLVHYLTDPATLSALDTARETSLGAIPDGPSKDDGIAVGQVAASAMIAERTNDGSETPRFFLPTLSDAGEWQLTPSCTTLGGVFFHWQDVKPFAIQSSAQFRSDPPPALTSNEYTKDYDEVKTFGAVGGSLRPDVARFYARVLALNVWNEVAQQLGKAYGNSLSENARAFALINMALQDAGISVMETKYYYRFWRPETAIRFVDDGNPNTVEVPDFMPFVITPCFPSYPSAHGSTSNAARRVAQEIWGAGGHSITLSAPSLNLTFRYTTLQDITDDIDDARVYGGIHFRFDQEAGERQGWRVGGDIYRTRLRPLQF
jgi:hypothetical protein